MTETMQRFPSLVVRDVDDPLVVAFRDYFGDECTFSSEEDAREWLREFGYDPDMYLYFPEDEV